MDRDRFRQLLLELHQELGSTSSLDPESREMLHEVLDDINRIEAEGETDLAGTAARKLREAVLRFETAHPQLSLAAGQVADALGKLGI
jgi:hypothetical protein